MALASARKTATLADTGFADQSGWLFFGCVSRSEQAPHLGDTSKRPSGQECPSDGSAASLHASSRRAPHVVPTNAFHVRSKAASRDHTKAPRRFHHRTALLAILRSHVLEPKPCANAREIRFGRCARCKSEAIGTDRYAGSLKVGSGVHARSTALLSNSSVAHRALSKTALAPNIATPSAHQ